MTQQALSEPAIRMRKRNEDGSSSVPPNEVLTGLRVSNDAARGAGHQPCGCRPS
jgi:hypothetical protein